MKVMVLVKASKDTESGVMPGEKLLADMMQFNEELVNAGITWAKRMPNPDQVHGELELRPVFEAEDFGEHASQILEQEARLRARVAK